MSQRALWAIATLAVLICGFIPLALLTHQTH